MGKFYVQSGQVRLVIDAESDLNAAVKAFQWSCERQAEIDASSPVELVRRASERGWLLDDEVTVNETGFESPLGSVFDTRDVVAVWQGVVHAIRDEVGD
jgi:hypothetical protein